LVEAPEPRILHVRTLALPLEENRPLSTASPTVRMSGRSSKRQNAEGTTASKRNPVGDGAVSRGIVKQ
jgi:hypothetical protein